MNCPHGKADEETCTDPGCTRSEFDYGGRRFRVIKLLCDSCGHGIATRRSKCKGLSLRTLRDFQREHPEASHQVHWKVLALDTEREIFGGGALPLPLDPAVSRCAHSNRAGFGTAGSVLWCKDCGARVRSEKS